MVSLVSSKEGTAGNWSYGSCLAAGVAAVVALAGDLPKRPIALRFKGGGYERFEIQTEILGVTTKGG